MFRFNGAIFMLLSLVQPRLVNAREKQPRNPILQSQGGLKCEDAKAVYSLFDEAYSTRILWKNVSGTENPPASVPKVYSPQRDAWMATMPLDFSKPGPYDHSIYFGSDDSQNVWKLTIVDVRDVGIQFLSEKLVFGQVWWGRFYATEFVLDLQQHKFIYREMAQYGAKSQPCQ